MKKPKHKIKKTKRTKPRKRNQRVQRKNVGRTEEGYPIYERRDGPGDTDWGSGYRIGTPGMPY